MRLKYFSILILFASLCMMFSCKEESGVIDLAGQWQVQLEDSAFVGQTYDITLPGTTDAAGIGYSDTITPVLTRNTMLHLSRKHYYVGKAIYTRSFEVDGALADHQLELTLERVLWTSKVFIDGQEVHGVENSLVTPHHHLIQALPKGTHTVAIEVDNTKQLDMSVDDLCHSYTDATQVKWNGILGKIELKKLDEASIDRVEVYPNVKQMTAEVKVYFKNTVKGGTITISLEGEKSQDGKSLQDRKSKAQQNIESGCNEANISIDMSDASLWNEFNPQLYTINVEYKNEDGTSDSKSVTFGMREIKTSNGKICVNDMPVFLRGTLECCIFPLTGTPPTEEQGWEPVFNTAKEWGLNHLRFHSWCPPDAAFRVADRMGFYVSIELPVWVTNLGHDRAVCDFMENEAENIIRNYGNHPSLCMISNGNELQYDFEFLNGLTAKLKACDNRHIYTTTSYTFEPGHGGKNEPEDLYFVTQKTDDGWVRGQGVFDVEVPSFNKNYNASMGCVNVPLVSHEIGQYAVYPDLKEIDSYTGTLIPHNLEAVRDDLAKKGLLDKAEDYLQSSGRLAAILYKEEIERAMKTREFSGYQLLGLQDFPGQGTALVGLVNSFWKSKGIVTPEWFRQFCAPVVPLANFEKAVWTNDEVMNIDFQIANYSQNPITDKKLQWQLLTASKEIVDFGETTINNVPNDDVYHVDILNLSLSKIKNASELTLHLAIEGTDYSNEWNIWVYPSSSDADVSIANDTKPSDANITSETKSAGAGVVVTADVNKALQALEKGDKVLLSPKLGTLSGLEGKFVPVFWSPIHFPKQAGTMGLLCNPEHPAFKDFPTENFGNWQWWRLEKRATVLNIDSLPQVTPIVESVDNFANNRRLATVFEANCGNGKLLFSAMDLLSDGSDSPEIRQFRNSLIKYMQSEEFKPAGTINIETIKSLFLK